MKKVPASHARSLPVATRLTARAALWLSCHCSSSPAASCCRARTTVFLFNRTVRPRPPLRRTPRLRTRSGLVKFRKAWVRPDGRRQGPRQGPQDARQTRAARQERRPPLRTRCRHVGRAGSRKPQEQHRRGSAEPNYIRHTTQIPAPNDPSFKLQWGLRNHGQTIKTSVGVVDATSTRKSRGGALRRTVPTP